VAASSAHSAPHHTMAMISVAVAAARIVMDYKL